MRNMKFVKRIGVAVLTKVQQKEQQRLQQKVDRLRFL